MAICVHKIRTRGQAVEIMIRGGHSDAAYVRDTLNHVAGVTITERSNEAMPGVVYLWVQGTEENPLRASKVARILRRDKEIGVVETALIEESGVE